MTTEYPDALDAFDDPTPDDKTNSSVVPHAAQHKNANDAIEAIQAELGTNPKGNFDSVRARIDAMSIDLYDVLSGGDEASITAEQVQDIVGAMLESGSGMTVSYDDSLDILTITNADRGSSAVATHVADSDPHTQYYNQTRGDIRYSLTTHNHDGAYSAIGHNHDSVYAPIVHVHSEYSPTGHTHSYAALSHTHASSDITDFTEAVQDVIGSTVTAGSHVTISYDDDNGILYVNSDAGGSEGTGILFYQDVAPATPSEGEMWFDTSTPIYGILLPTEIATPNLHYTRGGIFWYKDSIAMVDNGRFIEPVGGDSNRIWVSHTDFISDVVQSGFGGTAGFGANIGPDITLQSYTHPGIIALETGTTSNATAYAYFGTVTDASTPGAQAYLVGANMEFTFEAIVAVSNTQGGANNYNVDIGYFSGNNVSATDPTDGIFFKFNVSSTKWIASCTRAGVATTGDTGITASASTWYTLRIHVIGTSLAYFYVNDVLTNTITTGLPTTGSFGVGVAIGKRQSSTTTRLLYVDYIYHSHILTTTRT